MERIFDAEFALGHMNYWLFVILMMTGLYIVVARGNLLKKIVGLNLFQVAVFMLYISMGKISGGTAPILIDNPDQLYSNPLPHVLILTAIVVGVATTSLGLALIVRINETYGTIEEDEVLEIDHQMYAAEVAEMNKNKPVKTDAA
jgi:multicomponent Na+:H+ antiporter subunit C